MEWLVDIINSPNFARLSTITVVLIMIAWFLSKSGILSIHTKYVTLGIADKERNIIRQQMIHAHQSCQAFLQLVPHNSDFNEWRGKCIAELVYDEMINWIILNHIEDTDSYISLRQKAIWNIILSNVYKPEHKTDEFRDIVYKHVSDDIKIFVKIRKTYS